ncbi:hypothetical protein RM844_17265 [Streptomyces sp. DSM 44915]|uniref:Uncharacterized protein n=1 Tax=Streptomyces chisholmiae TaxID=3075540 RepID=A0ABU2JTH2_9ACTN|nr:hypothetical protein [Streptomyces sp. DSM 44915]MDT0268033.1 hypothetical protein [Streptomyces sp. DSM 44915]
MSDADARPPAAAEEGDVFLDVPVLKLDELRIETENLRAHISLQAEVLNLLKLNVGADVTLGKLELDLKGVDAQALLKVRLDQVAAIVGNVLATIDQNPRIVEQVVREATATAGGVVDRAGGAVEKTGEELSGGGDGLSVAGKVTDVAKDLAKKATARSGGT